MKSEMSKDSKDPLGDRMKALETAEAGRLLMPGLPTLVRLDGKGFSKFTRGLDRPFDLGVSQAMVLTTMYLVEQTNAKIGYTQSDEISLVLHADEPTSQIYFNGKVQKLTSVLASMATAKFNALIPDYVPSKIGELALFDCRVWSVPNKTEAANAILWRTLDAEKNSVSMVARTCYSHRELHGKNKEMQLSMLKTKGIDWDTYPHFFKFGTFVQRRPVEVQLSEDTLKKLPEGHPTTVTRNDVKELGMPAFRLVCNRESVIFDATQYTTFQLSTEATQAPRI